MLTALLAVMSQIGAADDRPVLSDWTLTTPEGRPVRFSEEAREQTTVLFFWATWCPYCKALMPHLQSIRLEYGDDVEILAINIFEDGDPAGFVRDAGYDFTLLLDGDKVAAAYGITGTPGVFIVGSERAVHFDLRRLPPHPVSLADRNASNQRKAAHMAPYWAAGIREAIDAVP